MTSSDVITPGDEHRDEVVGLMRVAFNMGASSLAERAAWLPVEKMRCVLEGIASSPPPARGTSDSGGEDASSR
jgi:hypothetical protein